MSVPAIALIHGHTGQHTPELAQCRTDEDAAFVETKLANRPLVFAAALLHDRDRLEDAAVMLEEAEHQDIVAEVGDVHRRLHGSDEPVHRDGEDREDIPLREVVERLSPAQLTLLVQQRQTRLDKKAIGRLATKYRLHVEFIDVQPPAPYPATWLHAKFLMLLFLIGLHGFLRVKAARFRRQQVAALGLWPLFALAILALAIIVFAVLRPF